MSEPLDRNLETLIRAGALPLRPDLQARARREFLCRATRPVGLPERRLDGGMALALLIGICAWVVGSIFQTVPGVPPPAARSGSPWPGSAASRGPAEAGPEGTRLPMEGSTGPHLPALSPPEGEELTLRPRLVFEGRRLSGLDLEGRASLPESTVLSLSLTFLEESWVNGRLEPKRTLVASGLSAVADGRFTFNATARGPGLYEAGLLLSAVFQNRARAPRTGLPGWAFSVAGWGDELVPRLGPGLREVDALGREALAAIDQFEKAAATEAAWRQDGGAILRRTRDLMERIETSESMRLYPASLGVLFVTLRSLAGAAPFFSWKEGQFDGPRSYHAPEQRMKTYRQEDFTFAHLRRYVTESGVGAGREMALWILKEIRRGGPRGALREALEKEAGHPGLAPFADRLGPASLEDLPALEKEIREP